jgi:hypothetical protein
MKRYGDAQEQQDGKRIRGCTEEEGQEYPGVLVGSSYQIFKTRCSMIKLLQTIPQAQWGVVLTEAEGHKVSVASMYNLMYGPLPDEVINTFIPLILPQVPVLFHSSEIPGL